MERTRFCSAEGRERAAKTRGWCGMHAERVRRWGDPNITKPRVRGACSIDRCERPTEARGWCRKHYVRWQTHGDPLWRPIPRTCAVDDCKSAYRAGGFCQTHYLRFKKHGDPNLGAALRAEATCLAPDCEKAPSVGRYCGPHASRLRKLNSFELPPRSERHRHSDGYVVVRAPGHPVVQPGKGVWAYAHRVALHDAIGPGEHECHWCGGVVSWERSYPRHADGLVVDHLDFDKTNNDPSNLVPSCNACNMTRGNSALGEVELPA